MSHTGRLKIANLNFRLSCNFRKNTKIVQKEKQKRSKRTRKELVGGGQKCSRVLAIPLTISRYSRKSIFLIEKRMLSRINLGWALSQLSFLMLSRILWDTKRWEIIQKIESSSAQWRNLLRGHLMNASTLS